MSEISTVDAVVVGGGAAGLSGAPALARGGVVVGGAAPEPFSASEPFSAASEAAVCELVLAGRRHGLD